MQHERDDGLRAFRMRIARAYLAFGKSSRWRSEPSGVLAAGSDIIDNTDGLEHHFIPLLGHD